MLYYLFIYIRELCARVPQVEAEQATVTRGTLLRGAHYLCWPRPFDPPSVLALPLWPESAAHLAFAVGLLLLFALHGVTGTMELERRVGKPLPG